MATYPPEWDTQGWKIGRVYWSFETAFPNCNDAAEGGSALKQGEEIGDDAGAGVEA